MHDKSRSCGPICAAHAPSCALASMAMASDEESWYIVHLQAGRTRMTTRMTTRDMQSVGSSAYCAAMSYHLQRTAWHSGCSLCGDSIMAILSNAEYWDLILK